MLSLVGGDSHGPGQPAAVVLAQHRRTVFGRLKPTTWEDAADVQFVLLDSPTLKSLTSRSHMQVTRRLVSTDAGDLTCAYQLEDLDSMNGVLVNKTKIKACELKEGDVIVVGAGKSLAVGQEITKSLVGISDLVYQFHADPKYTDTATTTTEGRMADEPRRDSGIRLVAMPAAAAAASSHSQLQNRAGSGGLVRSYSFKPSAKTRRVAANHNHEPAAAAASSPASTAAASDSAVASASAGSDSIDASEFARPKVSLAAHLSALAAQRTSSTDGGAAGAMVDVESSPARSNKRARPADDEAADGGLTTHEEKKQRVEVDEEELARRAAEAEAKTAAAVEEAVAAAKTEAAARAATASKAATTEGRQALASELSDEFQCTICCDLIVYATALSCSHTFCKTCIIQWLTKGGTSGKGDHTCPQCRQTIEGEPVSVRSLDNAIDRIALTSLTEDERKERKEKQTLDSKVVLPKIFEQAKAKKKSRSRPAAVTGPALAPAAGGGFSFGGFGGFGGAFPFGFGAAAPAAAAAAVAAPVDDDDDDYDDDYDEDDDGEDAAPPPSLDYFLEHARSGRSTCRGCRSVIAHGAARFGVTESDEYEYYQSTRYYHLQCYAAKLPRGTAAATIRGFGALTAAEKSELQRLLR